MDPLELLIRVQCVKTYVLDNGLCHSSSTHTERPLSTPHHEAEAECSPATQQLVVPGLCPVHTSEHLPGNLPTINRSNILPETSPNL